MGKIKVALFHPWIKSRGGAEKVLLQILKTPGLDVEVYTWAYLPKNTFEEFSKYKIKVILPKFAQKLSQKYLLRGLFLPFAFFSKIPLEKYEIFLISTSGVGEFVTFRNYKKGKTVAYCHTILRAAHKDEIKWNLKNRYSNFISKGVYLSAACFYRWLEKLAWKRIDEAIFNSELSRERAEEHNLLNGKKTEIIYPPIDYGKFRNIKVRNDNYFLYISRFNPNKRQELLVKAWEGENQKLILAGAIGDKKYFEKVKKESDGKNIEILTGVTDKKIVELYANSKAVFFLGYNEDFGITPFEAASLGKPLIITRTGGFFDLIKKYQGARFFSEGSDEEIILQLKKIIKSDKLKGGRRTFFREASPESFSKSIKETLLKCKSVDKG